MPEFTSDWFGHHPPYWTELFRARGWLPQQPHTIIEIGSFEGRSTLWMLENLLLHADSRIVCVDTFADRETPGSYWSRFEANVLGSRHAAKVEVAEGASLPALARFVAAGRKCDFVYVDGAHRAAEVLEDLILSFHALRPGGILICDDYLKGPAAGDELVLGSPKIAVDAFTTIYRDRLEIPWGQPLYQLAMVKTADRSPDHPGARGEPAAGR